MDGLQSVKYKSYFYDAFRNEIDISVNYSLILNHYQKILNVYSLYFAAIIRLILFVFFFVFLVILCIVFLHNTNKKTPPFRRGSSYRPGKECVFPIIYSLTAQVTGISNRCACGRQASSSSSWFAARICAGDTWNR